VAASLEGKARSVRVVEPAEGKDASDHLAAGHGLEEFVEAASPPAASGEPDRPHPDRRLIVTPFSSIEPEPVTWVWEGRIPLGSLTNYVGAPNVGKSTHAFDLAAKGSRGELSGDLSGEPISSLILSYEDHAAYTIRPRLQAAGADLSRVHQIRATQDGRPDLLSLPDDLRRPGGRGGLGDAAFLDELIPPDGATVGQHDTREEPQTETPDMADSGTNRDQPQAPATPAIDS
jgi:hypothetical protein